nr:MAG TPA: hypothetical protein [Caudoviricetes sp.]
MHSLKPLKLTLTLTYHYSFLFLSESHLIQTQMR